MTASSLPAVLAPAARSRFPHRARALLGIYAAPGVALDELTTGLDDWRRRRVAAAHEPGEQMRVGVRMAGTEADLQESIGSYFGETITPLDAFVTVDVDHDDPGAAELDLLVARLDGVGAELAAVVDRKRSYAMAGLVNLVTAADGPFGMMLMCMHQPDVALVDTHEWWCAFGEVMSAVSGGNTLGYHQLQCDPELSTRAAEAAGLGTTSFDLGDLVYLRDVDEFVAAARPQGAPAFDPGPPVNQRDDFITFRGSEGAFCSMLSS
jgi:hypothetical protein